MAKALKREAHTWMVRLFVCVCCNIVLMLVGFAPKHKNFIIDVPGYLQGTAMAAIVLVLVIPVLIKGTNWYRIFALLLMIFPFLMLRASLNYFSFIFR